MVSGSKPDCIYATIVPPNPMPADIIEEQPADKETDTVIYSDLQNIGAGTHTVTPSLYTNLPNNR